MATQKKSDNTTPASAPPEALAEGIKFTANGGKNGMDCPPPRCRLGDDIVDVRLSAQSTTGASDVELNTVIRYQLESTSFPVYQEFMNALMTNLDKVPGGMSGVAKQLRDALDHDGDFDGRADAQRAAANAPPLTKIQGTLAYEVLRLATEAFMLTRCGPACTDFRNAADFRDFVDDEGNRIETNGYGTEIYAAQVLQYVQQFLNSESSAATPYLQLIVKQLSLLPNKGDPLTKLYASRYECPMMIELIWSYWHEEAMLSQTMNAIAIRFQNRRSRAGNDPLANLEIDPLRPLNNVLWAGFSLNTSGCRCNVAPMNTIIITA